jgi:regulator of sirC expression with transglutaminase-like and TPR domain
VTTREPGPRARLRALAREPEDPAALAEAALWIAAEEYAGLDVPAYLRRLVALGVAARERVTPGMDADGCAGALGRLLFEEEGFRGNAEDYYDPRNSFLNEVLDRRLGIPITLSVVYMAVAGQAGVTARGIGLPGHFLVRLERGAGARLLDPFHGGVVLSEADCAARLRQLYGDRARLDPAHLEPVTTQQILGRMLANLKGIYMGQRDWGRALAAVERILLLRPGDPAELRDLGAIRGALAARN